VQLQARNLGGNSYLWLPSTGLNNNIIINPLFNYNQSQEFKISIKNALGCIITDTVLVTIKGKKGIYVPKAFSPNSDGVNDRLYPILVGISKLNYFRVYNRWGNLVFETNTDNPAAGWNGLINGYPQPPETYTWTAEGIDIDGIVIKKSGNTFLIR
jgi:gliding motility-associated-like protein